MDSVTPVLLHQTQKKYPQPILRLLLRKNNLLSNQTTNLSCYDDFQLVIQELDIHLEQQTVLAAWDTAQKTTEVWGKIFPSLFASQDSIAMSKLRADSDVGGPSIVSSFYSHSLFADSTDGNKLYIDRFNLNPIKINISFVMTPDIVSQTRDRSSGQNRDSALRYDGSGIFFAFSSFLRQVGEVVLDLSSNISNAPIWITGMQTEHLSMSNRELAIKLQAIYLQAIVSQVASGSLPPCII